MVEFVWVFLCVYMCVYTPSMDFFGVKLFIASVCMGVVNFLELEFSF